jgi:hypothetical protein
MTPFTFTTLDYNFGRRPGHHLPLFSALYLDLSASLSTLTHTLLTLPTKEQTINVTKKLLSENVQTIAPIKRHHGNNENEYLSPNINANLTMLRICKIQYRYVNYFEPKHPPLDPIDARRRKGKKCILAFMNYENVLCDSPINTSTPAAQEKKNPEIAESERSSSDGT